MAKWPSRWSGSGAESNPAPSVPANAGMQMDGGAVDAKSAAVIRPARRFAIWIPAFARTVGLRGAYASNALMRLSRSWTNALPTG